ncbi:hypothetical protein F8197_16170 [Duganella sp. FT27W]|nr:hypothetical protein [Duganella sp. FT27W]
MPGLPRTTLAGAFAGLVLLSGCATDGENIRTEPPKAATLKTVLADANAALKAGQGDKAQALLKEAATSYPADKAPWLQLAQIKFDRASYGEAITNAQEALRRDPVDTLANSIVAVSGLRVSTKALADLSAQNNLNGSLRTEARELAKLLRTTLGEEVLVPTVAPPPPVRAKTAPTTRKGAAKSQSSNDPFGGLK